MNDEFKQGYISYKKNNGAYINPYQNGTVEYNDFERGWTQANKRLPERDFSSGRYVPRSRKLETDAEKKARLKNEAIDKSMADYIKAKG